MTKLLGTTACLLGLGFVLNPAPADAQDSGGDTTCTERVLANCDELFPGKGPFSTAARGWCYLTGLASCAVQEHLGEYALE